jgi:hypothetical protein
MSEKDHNPNDEHYIMIPERPAEQGPGSSPAENPPAGEQSVKIPEEIPLLPIRDVVVFP